MLTQDPDDVFRTTRFALVYYFKYLATITYAVQPVYSEELVHTGGLTAVDSEWRLYFGPAFCGAPLETRVALLYHEIAGHLLRNHFARAKALGAEPIRWNVAADCAINDEAPRSGANEFPFPPGVAPDHYNLPKHQVEEWYYPRLISPSCPAPCGSGSGGVTLPCELAGPRPGWGPLAQESVRIQVAREIESAAGSVPGALRRWAQGYLHHKGDWKRELAALVTRTRDGQRGRDDWSFRTPSRRAPLGLLLPGMVSPDPRVGIVLDTSGSMRDTAELSQALAEIGALLQTTLPGGALVFCTDTQAYRPTEVHSIEQVVLMGGGGTDLRQGITAAASTRPRLDFLVVVTDGLTPWPPSVDLPVVIALVAPPERPVPMWATRVVECFS